jgi:hypothetical protein
LAKAEDVNSSFLASSQQQDASEFLTFLFDWVETEMARASVRSHSIENYDLNQSLSLNASGEPASSSRLIVRHRKRQREPAGAAPTRRRDVLKKSLLESATKLPVASSYDVPFGMSLALGSSITDWQSCDLLSLKGTNANSENYESKLHSNPSLHWLQFCVHRRRREHSLFSPNPFCGLQESSVTCTVCGYASTNYTKFLHLSLPIERFVYHFMKTYFSLERYNNVSGDTRKKKKCHGDATNVPKQKKTFGRLLTPTTAATRSNK